MKILVFESRSAVCAIMQSLTYVWDTLEVLLSLAETPLNNIGWLEGCSRRNLDGEENEAAAKHPSNIVTAVDVLGYSPGSTQLSSL